MNETHGHAYRPGEQVRYYAPNGSGEYEVCIVVTTIPAGEPPSGDDVLAWCKLNLQCPADRAVFQQHLRPRPVARTVLRRLDLVSFIVLSGRAIAHVERHF